MTVTAYLFHALVGLPLAVGFVFGAIISPPDAVAALAVTQNLRVPRKIIVILEGETERDKGSSVVYQTFAFEDDNNFARHPQILSDRQRCHGVGRRDEGAEYKTYRQR